MLKRRDGVHLHASEGGAEACGRPSLIDAAIRDAYPRSSLTGRPSPDLRMSRDPRDR